MGDGGSGRWGKCEIGEVGKWERGEVGERGSGREVKREMEKVGYEESLGSVVL